jgi:hypothetical protein
MIGNREIQVRRMADYLWDRYCEAGLINSMLRFNNARSKHQDHSDALTRTARATYRQFCKRHGLETGLTEGTAHAVPGVGKADWGSEQRS